MSELTIEAPDGLTIGVWQVHSYAYFYWCVHDFGYVFIDTYTHFFPIIFFWFWFFKNLMLCN